MKGKRCRLLIIFLLLAGSLCMGCAQAPDEVKKDTEKYGDNAQTEEAKEKTCTIEELRNSNVKDITQEYENIVLPDHIDFSGIQDISLLKFQFVKDYAKQKEKYAQAFGVSGELDWKQESLKETGEGGMTYDSKEKREYLSVGDNGCIYFEQKDGYTELDDGEDNEEEESEEVAIESDIQERIYLMRGG